MINKKKIMQSVSLIVLTAVLYGNAYAPKKDMSLNKADNSYKAGKENLRLEFYSSLMENHLPKTLV